MPTRRSVARLGARFIGGVVAIVMIGGGAFAATAFPFPSLVTTPVSEVVAPTPGEQQRVCPGPLYALAEDSSQAQAATSVGAAAAVYGARASAADEGDARPRVSDIDAVDNASSASAAPILLTVPVDSGAAKPPLVAGSQSQTLATETLGGLAVASCAEARSDAWLVGGSTDVGRTSLLLLSNPTTVLATVDLTVFGETGLVDAPGSTGILVQPGQQRVISLAGLAPNLKSPVVHVESGGGQVAASLQQSSVRGLEPGGVELLGASSGPALEQVIAGLQVTGPAADPSAEVNVEGFPEDTPSVRLLVPGDEPATVQVGVTSATGDASGTSLQVDLQPGIATEVPFPSLGPGSYAVEIRSDQPVVTSAHSATVGGVGKDFAWYAASDALGDDFLVSVAAGPAPVLHLVNTASTDARLTVTPESGTALTVTVAAGAPADLPLAPSTRYVVTGGRSLIAAVGYAGEGDLSSFALNPAGPLAAPIRVYAH